MKLMNWKFNLTWLVLFAVNTVVAAPVTPRHSPVPGGIVVVELPAAKSALRPTARLQNKRVMVVGTPEHWQAVVGIPLDTEPGQLTLEITDTGSEPLRVSFVVTAKEYKTQHLTLENKRMVEPTAADLRRIEKETEVIANALRQFSEGGDVAMNFILPVQGRLSSPFGLKRFFNDQARKPHSGLDLAAPIGTPIKAPAAGKVIATGNFFFNGNSVFLDHGQGLISMYSHMERIAVNPDQQVEQGVVLGTVGMTGRATGPHLHWTISLNDTRVDPILLFSEEIVAQLSSGKNAVSGNTGSPPPE